VARAEGDRPFGLSIVICTHNGAARLPATLAHLAQQTDSRSWEILLVDNASTDGTWEAAEAIWRRLGAPAPLRRQVEPRLGVGHARLTGVRQAAFCLVSFVDDDNWVCSDWVKRVLSHFESHPETDVLACGSTGAFDSGHPPPGWFAAVGEGYAVGARGTDGLVAGITRYPTAGLSFRRAAMLDIFEHGFSPLLVGRQGSQLSAGEDAELCYAMAMRGRRFWYDARLTFAHFMPPGRLTLSYARKLYFGLGEASATEDLYWEIFTRSSAFSPRNRLKRNDTLRRAVALLKLGRLRLAAFAGTSADKRAIARIRADYFAGRLHAIRDAAMQRTLRARVAETAERLQGCQDRAPAGPAAPLHSNDFRAKPGR
jgi:glycosyltransferase involved in cell wall biosynthesis